MCSIGFFGYVPRRALVCLDVPMGLSGFDGMLGGVGAEYVACALVCMGVQSIRYYHDFFLNVRLKYV